jgi:hypothetical protein
MPHASSLIPAPIGSGKPSASEPVEFGPDGVELGLEGFELLTHAEDDIDAREVNAQFVDETLRVAYASEVVVRIHADVADRATGLDEPGAFVVAKRLLVDPDEARCDGDDVAGLIVRQHFAISIR